MIDHENPLAKGGNSGLWHWSRQALAGRRAIRLAGRHAVAPPPSILDAARRLGIRRLVVTDDPERRAFCAGLIRPTTHRVQKDLDRARLERVAAIRIIGRLTQTARAPVGRRGSPIEIEPGKSPPSAPPHLADSQQCPCHNQPRCIRYD